eukprot:Amastigsp_a840992_1606.p1 type:complete len:149 gc:universal Amastigsp_a840992_1606:515-69(-)
MSSRVTAVAWMTTRPLDAQRSNRASDCVAKPSRLQQNSSRRHNFGRSNANRTGSSQRMLELKGRALIRAARPGDACPNGRCYECGTWQLCAADGLARGAPCLFAAWRSRPPSLCLRRLRGTLGNQSLQCHVQRGAHARAFCAACGWWW